jgi:hypothetical protein
LNRISIFVFDLPRYFEAVITIPWAKGIDRLSFTILLFETDPKETISRVE